MVFGGASFGESTQAGVSGYQPPSAHAIAFSFSGGAYAPPANNGANFNFTVNPYTPPGNNAANFNFAPVSSYTPPLHAAIAFVFGSGVVAVRNRRLVFAFMA